MWNFSNMRHEYKHFHWNLKKGWNVKLKIYSGWPQERCFRLIFLKSELLKVGSIDVNRFGIFKMHLPWNSNTDFEHMKQLLLFLVRYIFCKFIFNESNKLLVIFSNMSVRSKELLFLFCFFLFVFIKISRYVRIWKNVPVYSLPVSSVLFTFLWNEGKLLNEQWEHIRAPFYINLISCPGKCQ